MSKFTTDEDGFQVVKHKRFSKNKQTKLPNKQINFEKEEASINIDTALRKIQTAVEDIRSSKYLKDLSKSVSTILQSKRVVEIVCFGLGHIGECNISRHQLALLLCLEALCDTRRVLVHDPIFYKDECEVLKRLGLKVIKQNNEGSYVISDKGITLVYLPHCPQQLTNNFLWSNWGVNIQNCILISNSFSSLVENQPNRILLDTVPYIHKLYPYTSEIRIENNFKYTDIFNNTSLHYFTEENFKKISLDFWKRGAKPAYENTEEFITSLMVEKLNI